MDTQHWLLMWNLGSSTGPHTQNSPCCLVSKLCPTLEWPWLSLMLCSCCLEILNNIYMYIFNQGALHFHFVLGPTTNLADLSHVIFSHYSWGRCIEYKEFGMKEIDTIALDGRSLKITKTLPIVYFKSVCFLFQIIIAVLEAEISDPAIFHDMIWYKSLRHFWIDVICILSLQFDLFREKNTIDIN